MAIDIRPLEEADLSEANRIFRLAFGTFIGLPDPMGFAPGADLIATRWRAGPHIASFGAYQGDRLIGSNIMSRWGSFGFFGPLTVHPDYWDKGIARRLLDPTLNLFAEWDVQAAGLYTFPQSPKHLALYQKYDFWPQRLTAVMGKPPSPDAIAALPWAGSRGELLAATRAVTGELFPGLDLGGEIEAVLDQELGEIVVIADRGAMAGFAICHFGEGSEAGTGAAYIKFAAVRPGRPADFDRLLAACEAAAASRGLGLLRGGVNTACQTAYQAMQDRGFRIQMTGVAMQRGNLPGYLRSDALVIGDWR